MKHRQQKKVQQMREQQLYICHNNDSLFYTLHTLITMLQNLTRDSDRLGTLKITTQDFEIATTLILCHIKLILNSHITSLFYHILPTKSLEKTNFVENISI